MASSRPQWATSQQPRTSSASRWQPQYLQPHQRRTEVVRDWSSYYAASGASHWQSVRLVDGPGDGGKERFTLSFRPHFRQADVWLKRGDTYMSDMCNRCREHPLAVGSVHHDSIYNLKFTTVLGFDLTFGYSRHKSTIESQITHAWIAFGARCTEPWQKRYGVDFLLHICGLRSYYSSHAPEQQDVEWPLLAWFTDPIPGADSPGLTQPPEDAAEEPGQRAASSSQPLAGTSQAQAHFQSDTGGPSAHALLLAESRGEDVTSNAIEGAVVQAHLARGLQLEQERKEARDEFQGLAMTPSSHEGLHSHSDPTVSLAQLVLLGAVLPPRPTGPIPEADSPGLTQPPEDAAEEPGQDQEPLARGAVPPRPTQPPEDVAQEPASAVGDHIEQVG